MKNIDELIQEILSDYNDEELSSSIKSAEGTASTARSHAGFQVSQWKEEELVEKIIQCFIVLVSFRHSGSRSQIFKLLGMDKSCIYRNDSGEYKVSALMNGIFSAHYFHTQGQDPYFPEHMHSTKGSVKVGSGTIFELKMFDKPYEEFKLTANQELYAYSLLPIFSDNMNFPIVIGTGDGCLSANDFMTLVLFMALSRREWFHYNTTTDTMLTYCEHLNNFIQNIVSSGRVHSKNKALDYLNRRDKRYLFTKLISRGGSYRNGMQSYKYTPTIELLAVFHEALCFFNELEIELLEQESKASDLVIPKETFATITPRDVYILLNHLVGCNDHGDYIIDNTSSIMDKQKSRVYSLFTSLKSATRTKLGFINYDISTCMQTIVSHFVNMDNYPVHQDLIDDKHYFRGLLAIELEKDIDGIKQVLSSADNGKQHRRLCVSNPVLTDYVNEASELVDEFLKIIEEQNPDMIQTATSYAKFELEIVEWVNKQGFDKKQPKFATTGEFNKYSLFFFVWTQIEREIREAMMSCFDGFVHQVHDAVYSKEDVEIAVLEKAVLDRTGIKVKIEH